MHKGFRGAACAAGLTALTAFFAAGPAMASTYQITFGASDFSSAPAPRPFVLGQVDVSFDPAADAGTFATGPATLDFLNLNVSNVGYFYNGFQDVLIIGGVVVPGDLPNGINPGSGKDDFMLFIGSFSTAPSYSALTYFTMADPLHMFISHLGSVHVGIVTPSVGSVATTPVPATLPLFSSALGGLGFVGWRRRLGHRRRTA